MTLEPPAFPHSLYHGPNMITHFFSTHIPVLLWHWGLKPFGFSPTIPWNYPTPNLCCFFFWLINRDAIRWFRSFFWSAYATKPSINRTLTGPFKKCQCSRFKSDPLVSECLGVNGLCYKFRLWGVLWIKPERWPYFEAMVRQSFFPEKDPRDATTL